MPKTGSFEVRFVDGRLSQNCYYDDVLGQHLRKDILPSEQALEQAKALARAERDWRKMKFAPSGQQFETAHANPPLNRAGRASFPAELSRSARGRRLFC